MAGSEADGIALAYPSSDPIRWRDGLMVRAASTATGPGNGATTGKHRRIEAMALTDIAASRAHATAGVLPDTAVRPRGTALQQQRHATVLQRSVIARQHSRTVGEAAVLTAAGVASLFMAAASPVAAAPMAEAVPTMGVAVRITAAAAVVPIMAAAVAATVADK